MIPEVIEFNRCTSRIEVKNLYRVLAKKYHPDTGGNAFDFKLLVTMYESALDIVTKLEQTPFNKEHAQIFSRVETVQSNSKFADLIEQVKALQYRDIIIVQRDQWLWIENTKKDMYYPLKNLGFEWSRKRKAFYFAENLAPKRSYASKLSKDDLDRKYSAKTC